MSDKKFAWHTHLLDPSTERSLLDEAHKTFFPDRSKAYLDWLYYKNPAGPLFCYMALDGSTVAGQYVVIPTDLNRDGTTVPACTSLDTFTHENYRKQGIFTKLAEALFAHVGEQGRKFTMGFPNQNSRPGFLKNLKFMEPIPVYELMRPFNYKYEKAPEFLKRAAAALPTGFAGCAASAAKRITFMRTQTITEDFVTSLWERVKTSKVLTLKKDWRWTNWRYNANPAENYEFLTATGRGGLPSGYAVWNRSLEKNRAGMNCLRLADVVAADETTRFCLIAEFLDVAARECDAVYAKANLRTTEGALHMANAFIPRTPVSFIIRKHDDNLNLSDAYGFDGFAVSSAYTDFV